MGSISSEGGGLEYTWFHLSGESHRTMTDPDTEKTNTETDEDGGRQTQKHTHNEHIRTGTNKQANKQTNRQTE